MIGPPTEAGTPGKRIARLQAAKVNVLGMRCGDTSRSGALAPVGIARWYEAPANG
jgi:hypothetical protein